MHRLTLTTGLSFVAVIALLAGCAAPPRSADPSGVARRTVPELVALRPAALNAAITSALGERAVFEAEAISLRATLALPPGPEADDKLPAALSAAALFNIEKDAVRAHLLKVLPTAADKSAPYQREVLTAAHTQYWKEAAPLIPALLPQIKTPREFAIAAYTLLRDDDAATQRLGRGLVEAMPVVLSVLANVGTLAMLWVGGGIVLHGLHELGFHAPANAADALRHTVEGVSGGLSGVLGWLTYALASAVAGMALGSVIAMVVHAVQSRRGAKDAPAH